MYVREYREISIFNLKGDFIRSFPLDAYVVAFSVDDEGYILGYADLRQRDNAVRGIVKINSQGKIVKKIAEYNDLGIKIIVGEGATFTLSPNHMYTPRLLFASLGPKIFVYSYASEYLLNLIDNDGNLLLRIQKEASPIPISQKEKKVIINRACESLKRSNIKVPRKKVEEILHFNKYRSYINKIITDNKQRLYVQIVKSVLDQSNEVEFDVFNMDGYYLYKTNLPQNTYVIKNGYIYVLELEDEEVIKRFRIKNWGQIKE